jgi:lysophospholipase L1-like esterase
MEVLMRRVIAALLLSALVLAGSARAAVPPRILVIGDSLASGAHATGPQAAYAALVANALDAPALLVQPAGDLTAAEQAWARAEGGVWDVVIIEIGINDTAAGPLTDAWSERYARLIASIRVDREGGRVVCVTPFDIGVPDLADDLAARAGAIRATPGCQVADVYAATAGRADLRAPVGALTFYGSGVAGDAMHSNNDGHALIADLILETIAWPEPTHLPLIR